MGITDPDILAIIEGLENGEAYTSNELTDVGIRVAGLHGLLKEHFGEEKNIRVTGGSPLRFHLDPDAVTPDNNNTKIDLADNKTDLEELLQALEEQIKQEEQDWYSHRSNKPEISVDIHKLIRSIPRRICTAKTLARCK